MGPLKYIIDFFKLIWGGFKTVFKFVETLFKFVVKFFVFVGSHFEYLIAVGLLGFVLYFLYNLSKTETSA